MVERRLVHAPAVLEVELTRRGIDPVVAPGVPAFGFAERDDHCLEGAGRMFRGGERARHLVLPAADGPRAALHRPVAPDAVVADKAAVGAEDRLAADAHV